MKKRLMALLMVLVFCMSMALTGCNDKETTPTGSTGTNTPVEEVTLANAIAKTANDMFHSPNSPSALLERAMNKGKITIELGDQLKNTLYLDSDNKTFSNLLSVAGKDQSLSFGIYRKDQEFAVSAPEILGNTVYGVNLKNLAADLPGSAIWSVTGIDYDTFMSEYKEQLGQITGLLEGANDSKLQENINKLTKDITKALEGVEVTTQREKTSVYDAEVDAVVITYHLEKEDIEKLFGVMFDWAEAFAADLFGGLEDSLNASAPGSKTSTGIEEAFDEMRADMATAFKAIEATAVFRFYINPETEYLMKADCEINGKSNEENAKVNAVLTLGVNPIENRLYTLSTNAEVGDEKMSTEFTVSQAIEGQNEVTTFTISANANGEKQTQAFTFKWNKGASTYEFTGNVGGNKTSVSGALTVMDEKLCITLDQITAGGETTDIGLSITVEAAVADMPAMPEYSNILKLSKDELIALMEILGQTTPEIPMIPDNPDYPTPDVPEEDDNDNKYEVEIASGILANGPVVVYNANGVKFTCTELVKDRSGDYALRYKIQNDTNGCIYLSAGKVAINGVMMEGLIHEEIEAGYTITGNMRLYAEDLSAAGISNIYNIRCYDGSIVDAEKYRYSYSFGYELDCGDVSYVEKITADGILIYEGNGIKIINHGVSYDDYGNGKVRLLVINNRKDHIIVAMDDVVANNFKVQKFGYAYAYAGTASYYEFYWFEEDLEEIGGRLKNMEFTVEIEDMLTYKNYAKGITARAKFD